MLNRRINNQNQQTYKVYCKHIFIYHLIKCNYSKKEYYISNKRGYMTSPLCLLMCDKEVIEV